MKEVFLFEIEYKENEIEKFTLNDELSYSFKSFYSQKAENYSGIYRPEKLVYTGATVGGIHTGGVHKEEAYVELKSSANGNGCLKYDGKCLESVTLSQELLEVAKEHPVLGNLIEGNKISLLKPFTYDQRQKMQRAVMGGYDAYSQIEIANIQTSRYILYDYCVEIAKFLNDALNGSIIPETAEIVSKMKEIKREMDKKRFREDLPYKILLGGIIAAIIGIYILIKKLFG